MKLIRVKVKGDLKAIRHQESPEVHAQKIKVKDVLNLEQFNKK